MQGSSATPSSIGLAGHDDELVRVDGQAQAGLHLRDRQAGLEPLESQLAPLRPREHVHLVEGAPEHVLALEAGHLRKPSFSFT
jgi:hypothetical protein